MSEPYNPYPAAKQQQQQSNPPLQAPQFKDKAPINGQPTESPGMRLVAGGNLNPRGMPRHAITGERVWTSGICSCADGRACLLACVCPCVAFSKVKRRSDHLAQKGYPDPEHGGGCFTSDCMLHCCITSFFGSGWVFQIFQRGAIRTRYGIKGNGCTDCLAAFCCTPCELSQESHEIGLEEQSYQNIAHV